MFHYIYCLPIGVTIVYLLLISLAWSLGGGWLCAEKRLPNTQRWWRVACGVLAVIWLAVVLAATLFFRSEGVYSAYPLPLEQLRAVLAGENPELLRSWWMNVLLFVPCGVVLPEILPRAWSRKRRILATILTALLLSLGIELAQWHWQLGRAEADDCLANILGGLLGSGIFYLRCRMTACLIRHSGGGRCDL